MDIIALWDGDRYTCEDQERWWSENGKEWYGQDGQPACGDRFDAANIKLVGGPHDGEWVS